MWRAKRTALLKAAEESDEVRNKMHRSMQGVQPSNPSESGRRTSTLAAMMKEQEMDKEGESRFVRSSPVHKQGHKRLSLDMESEFAFNHLSSLPFRKSCRLSNSEGNLGNLSAEMEYTAQSEPCTVSSKNMNGLDFWDKDLMYSSSESISEAMNNFLTKTCTTTTAANGLKKNWNSECSLFNPEDYESSAMPSTMAGLECWASELALALDRDVTILESNDSLQGSNSNCITDSKDEEAGFGSNASLERSTVASIDDSKAEDTVFVLNANANSDSIFDSIISPSHPQTYKRIREYSNVVRSADNTVESSDNTTEAAGSDKQEDKDSEPGRQRRGGLGRWVWKRLRRFFQLLRRHNPSTFEEHAFIRTTPFFRSSRRRRGEAY